MFDLSIVNEKEVTQLGRKGAAAMAVFKVVTIVIILAVIVGLCKGYEPNTIILAYLAFAPIVLGIFTTGNVKEHQEKTKQVLGTVPAKTTEVVQ